MRASIVALSVVFFIQRASCADGPAPLTLTAALTGAHCEECTGALRTTLAGLPGVRCDGAEVKAGTAPEFYSSHFVLEILDPSKTEIGSVAKAVAGTETAHKATAAPRLFVLFPWKATLAAGDAKFQKGMLARLDGVSSNSSFAGDRFLWVRLTSAGNAKLREIVDRLVGAGLIDDPQGPKESGGWVTDYAAARERALKERKPILLVFR